MRRVSWMCLLLTTVLCVHLTLLLYSAWQDSPVHAELQQLPAGLYHWQYCRFDFADVNPPLVRLIAALPVSWMSPNVDWQHWDPRIYDRPEYDIGHKFVEANGMRCQKIFFVGRCACIPFTLLGALLCWCWAKQLYGELAGLLATTLWCFSPWILGHGHLISADIAAASMALAVAYSVSTWLRARTWSRASFAGFVLGVAQLTKLTLLIAYPLILIWTLLFSVFGKPVAAAPTTSA